MAKKSKDTADFTVRILLGMVVEMSEASATVERLRIQVETLAAAHGIAVPAATGTACC
jgi:hypothetical protein